MNKYKGNTYIGKVGDIHVNLWSSSMTLEDCVELYTDGEDIILDVPLEDLGKFISLLKGVEKMVEEDQDYEPHYFVSENGVGYMPSSEIIKTESFKKQLEAAEGLRKSHKLKERK